MYIKEVTYTDYLGNTRTETFCFNLSKTELFEKEHSEVGGLFAKIRRDVAAENKEELVKAYKNLLLTSYGKISPDGRRFQKGEEIQKEFEESPAYDIIFMELVTNPEMQTEFINDVAPIIEEDKGSVAPPQVVSGKV